MFLFFLLIFKIKSILYTVFCTKVYSLKNTSCAHFHTRIVNAAPICYPIGLESQLKGVIDIVEMKAWIYSDVKGEHPTEIAIPEEYLDRVTELRASLIENLANYDDDFMAFELQC